MIDESIKLVSVYTDIIEVNVKMNNRLLSDKLYFNQGIILNVILLDYIHKNSLK